MWTIIRELTQRGYAVTLNCLPAGVERETYRADENNAGDGKPWSVTILEDNNEEKFFTGYGGTATQACAEAMKKAGVQIAGVTI